MLLSFPTRSLLIILMVLLPRRLPSRLEAAGLLSWALPRLMHWDALEDCYSNSSVERIHSLRESLRNLQNGTSRFSDYGRQFKGICDKLAAIGQPVDEIRQASWSQHGQQNYSRGGGRASYSNGGRGRGGRRPPQPVIVHLWALLHPLVILHTYASNAATSRYILCTSLHSQCPVTHGLPDCSSIQEGNQTGDSTGTVRWALCASRLLQWPWAATVGVSRKASFDYGIIWVDAFSFSLRTSSMGYLLSFWLQCLDPDSSVYILLACTGLMRKMGPPISDASVPESRPTDTRPSSLSQYGLCPVPTTTAEPIHEPDSNDLQSPYSSEVATTTDSDGCLFSLVHFGTPATAPYRAFVVHR
ncbi:hypothetical protein Tco_0024271 [Tanacetum coccineum]